MECNNGLFVIALVFVNPNTFSATLYVDKKVGVIVLVVPLIISCFFMWFSISVEGQLLLLRVFNNGRK